MEQDMVNSAGKNKAGELASSKSLPWRARITLRLLSILTDASRRRDGTVNRPFINFFNLKASASPDTPINGVTSSDVTVDPSRNLWFRLFVPITTTKTSSSSAERPSKLLPVMVFFHGGGFTYLSADAKVYDAVCRRFARKIPAVVVSVDYRLSPEHRYPAQFDDGFDVLRFLDNENQGSVLPENADLSRCFLAGDSAGANIAHHVAIRASAQSTLSTLKVVGLISIQPFFGGEERTDAELRLTQLVTVQRTDWHWKAFLPEVEYQEKGGRDHPAVNVSGPRAMDISSLDSFPRTMVFVGGLDALQDWQRRYYHWLKNTGKEATLVEYPTMCHAFYIFPYLPESGQLISLVADFVSSFKPKLYPMLH